MARESTKFHKEIGFPDIDYPTGTLDLAATQHAIDESNTDRYGTFTLPTQIVLDEQMYQIDPSVATGDQPGDITLPHVFEMTIEMGYVTKLAVRMHYDYDRDIILIIKPGNEILVTAWINLKGDDHETLDRSEYADPSDN